MTLKLAWRNIRASVRDYAIYFVTLLFGVAVFYAFNSLTSQQVMFDIQSRSTANVFDLLGSMMGFFSVVVACVLAFLILYSNGFLIRRRKREFGTYLLLGMSPGQTSRIMLVETAIVGLVALAAGLVIGFLLSQALVFVTAALFGTTIQQYRFVFSPRACMATVACFVVIFAVAAVFNTGMVRRQKLITLLSANTSNQKVAVRNPWVCLVAFAASVAVIAYAYSQLGESGMRELSDPHFIRATVCMLAGTFILFWSLAGFIIAIVTRSKSFYLRGLRPFTVRQIASRVNTAFISLWAICVMLFFSITTFSCGMGLMGALTGNAREANPYSASLIAYVYSNWDPSSDDPAAGFKEAHPDEFAEGAERSWEIAPLLESNAPQAWTQTVRDSAQLDVYLAPDINYAELVDKLSPAQAHKLSSSASDRVLKANVDLVGVSQVNATRTLLGQDAISLDDEQCAIMNNADVTSDAAREFASSHASIRVSGRELTCTGDVVSLQMSDNAVLTTTLTLIVPESVIDSLKVQGAFPHSCYLNLMYADNGKTAAENDAALEKIVAAAQPLSERSAQVDGWAFESNLWPVTSMVTQNEMAEQAGGIRMLITYLAVYIGFVLLIATGAVLAVQQLSTTSDSLPRYRMLSRLGCSEKSISRSLLAQVCVYFLLPLAVAVCHSACAIHVLNESLFSQMGTPVLTPILMAAVLVFVIYGGYLLVTYTTARSTVRSAR